MITPRSSPSAPRDAERQRDLHPVLSAAVDCLDLDLEAELARYQRMAQPLAESSLAQGVGAAAVQADGSGHKVQSQQSSSAIAPTTVTLLNEDDSLALVTADALEREDDLNTSAPEAYLESSEELLKSLDDLEDLAEDPTPKRWRLSSVFTPLTVGLMLLVGLSSLTLTYAFFRARSVQIARQEPAAFEEGDRSPLSPLSPNLTVGEFTKLDLSRLVGLPMFKSARTGGRDAPPINGLGLEASDDEELSPDSEPPELNADTPERVDILESPIVAPASPPPAIAPQPAGPAPALPVEPIAPAPPTVVNTPRAARSAADSRETSSASEAPASEAPTSEAPTSEASAPKPPAPQPNAARVRPPLPAAGSDLRNSPQRSTAPASTAPPATPPAPAAQPSNSAPPAGPSSNAEGSFHHVVTPYTGDRSLQEAREAVSGAYVRNASGSAQVQLGAFESESQAEQFVDELAEQGIDATIQP
ncbi:MAG: SPOR domain-containing protein [Elainellaceae cyanobacterium]